MFVIHDKKEQCDSHSVSRFAALVFSRWVVWWGEWRCVWSRGQRQTQRWQNSHLDEQLPKQGRHHDDRVSWKVTLSLGSNARWKHSQILDCSWPLGGDATFAWVLTRQSASCLSTVNFIRSAWTSPSKPWSATSHTTTHPARADPPPRTCTPFEPHPHPPSTCCRFKQLPNRIITIIILELSTTVVSFPFLKKRFVHSVYSWSFPQHEKLVETGRRPERRRVFGSRCRTWATEHKWFAFRVEEFRD